MSDIDSLLENKHLFDMLEFETQIFLDILHKDGLVVTAKGLNMHVVLMNIFKVYCDPGNLVIVLNFTEFEEKYFIEKLNDVNMHTITCITNTTDREDSYLSGGVHFVTTRILVVDMLKKRIPIEKITGIIVLRAHSVLESCQEAFVLRLYRQRNKVGFIKAFSNCAQSFTTGFGHVERVMRTLFVKELYIWPRFHSIIIQSLKQFEPQVIEIHVPVSTTMSKIQTCILDLMNLTVKELKHANKTLEMQEITVENCLVKKFHKILQNQLDCIWHQLSSKSKQLIADLKTLRHLIISLLYTDPVTFYSILSEYRKMEYAQTSMWVLLQPAELLFTQAATLIYSGDKELNPEFCPKWTALSEILKVEIPHEITKSKMTENNVLILCQDTRCGYQLNEFLTHGPQHHLFLTALKRGVPFKSINKKFEGCENLKDKYSQKQVKDKKLNSSKVPKKSKLENEIEKMMTQKDTLLNGDEKVEDDSECFKTSYLLTMSQSMSESLNADESIENSPEYIFEPYPEMENMDLTQLGNVAKTNCKPAIVIQAFKTSNNILSLQQTLEYIKPNYIIMYHSDIAAIRQIELYEARRKKDHPLKVYFLIHNETVEEQSYLTSLRREKQAFEFLINTKSTMVVPEDQDGKTDECVTLQNETVDSATSTRHGGKINDEKKQSIIVDMREFRSELPALIHKRGIDIEPVTITVGDYILTSEICVERKSLSDLIGSLNSGRLYQQCTQMSRYYTKPMLLIEFDQNKPFSWQNNFMVSHDGNSFDIQQKLLLLTLHFPKLKIIWSPSPYASAQLFQELKDGKDQPNVEYTAAIGSAEDLDLIETKYNSSIYDFVQKLPGITSKNIDGFLRQTKNMNNAVKKSEDELKEILGNPLDAKAFHSILHEEHAPKELVDQIKSKGKKKTKFQYTKKKPT